MRVTDTWAENGAHPYVEVSEWEGPGWSRCRDDGLLVKSIEDLFQIFVHWGGWREIHELCTPKPIPVLSFAVWLPWSCRLPKFHTALFWHQISLLFGSQSQTESCWRKTCQLSSGCSWWVPQLGFVGHILLTGFTSRVARSGAFLGEKQIICSIWGDQSGEHEGNQLVGTDYPENMKFSAGNL